VQDLLQAHGRYDVVCYGPDGKEKWRDVIDNLVTTQGKNYALDTYLAMGAGGVTHMGLISSTSFSALAATDTAAQINGSNGWKEANTTGNTPTYTGNRKICTWSAASAGTKALTIGLLFSFSGAGTVKGGFITIGSTSTPGATTGFLYSAGLFTSGDRVVAIFDTIQVSYTASL
jgi:hypothetical protein